MTNYFLGLPNAVYVTRGATYTASSVGLVTVSNTPSHDIQDLIAMGLTETLVPPNVASAMGGASPVATFGSFTLQGGIYRIAGASLGANAADTTDDILGGIQLPASVFDAPGRAIKIVVAGKTGATTNNKRIKVFVNPVVSGQTVTAGVYSAAGTVTSGTATADTGAWVNGTTANNAAGWFIELTLVKYGANGSNTQLAQFTFKTGTLDGGVSAPVLLTTAENAAINIVITGSSYTTGAAADVVLNMISVSGLN